MTKQTKKGESTLDIKPSIYEWKADKGCLYLLVDASSKGNIKPSLVMEHLHSFGGWEWNPAQIQITREETYTNLGSENELRLVPLDAVGETF